VSSINPAAGGVAEAILRMSQAVMRLGHEMEVVSLDPPDSPWKLPMPVYMKGPGGFPMEYSRGFARWMNDNCGRFDVIISHGVFRMNSPMSRSAALRAGRPYFVMTHGFLDPWFKRYYPLKHLKKCFWWWTMQYAVLRDATAVLFTCEEEKLLARQGGFWPYRCVERVVPLGTSEPPGDKDAQLKVFAEKFPELNGKRVILFLGRLHEKKGCDLLLLAFRSLLESKPPEVWRDLHLMIAGPCAHPEYLAKLKELAAACEAIAPGCVSFPGMLTGDQKWGAIRRAEVFVLPSHQENFGLAVVEALACGTPVLISRPVNIWREIEASGAGLVDEDNVEGCLRLLERWLTLSPEQRATMSGCAVASFRQNFEISQTATVLIDTIRSFELKPAARSAENS
jgi:glycosyltransferase involved in cell wall biosynthesis